MWWDYHHGFSFFPCIFPFGLLILFALCFIVTRIVLFSRFRRFGRGYCGLQYGPCHGDRDAETILKRRLANGDITEAEYKQLKDVLNQ